LLLIVSIVIAISLLATKIYKFIKFLLNLYIMNFVASNGIRNIEVFLIKDLLG